MNNSKRRTISYSSYLLLLNPIRPNRLPPTIYLDYTIYIITHYALYAQALGRVIRYLKSKNLPSAKSPYKMFLYLPLPEFMIDNPIKVEAFLEKTLGMPYFYKS